MKKQLLFFILLLQGLTVSAQNRTITFQANTLKDKIKGLKYRYWSPCKSKGGYSGTAIFSKKKPISEHFGLQDEDGKELDDEGRAICLEFDSFFLLHCYTPNSGVELDRLDYRVKIWDVAFRNYIIKLQKKKAWILYCHCIPAQRSC